MSFAASISQDNHHQRKFLYHEVDYQLSVERLQFQYVISTSSLWLLLVFLALNCRDVKGLNQNILYECKVPSIVYIRQQPADNIVDLHVIPDQVASSNMQQLSADSASTTGISGFSPKASGSMVFVSSCAKVGLKFSSEIQLEPKLNTEHVLQPVTFELAHAELASLSPSSEHKIHVLRQEPFDLAHPELAPPSPPSEHNIPEALPEQYSIEFQANQDPQAAADSEPGINSEPFDISTWVFNSLGLQNLMALVSVQPAHADQS